MTAFTVECWADGGRAAVACGGGFWWGQCYAAGVLVFGHVVAAGVAADGLLWVGGGF